MSSEAGIAAAGSADDWRACPARNCRSASEVRLILRHHDGATPSLRYHEAVEQALCSGWIDGPHRRCGADGSHLRSTPRTARSRWSRLSRQRAAEMIERGLMTEHGQAAIERAKAAGTRRPLGGLPPNPGAWIVTTARNRAIDRLRRESVRDERHAQAHHLYGAHAADETPPQEGTVPDDRLRLIFTGCHPALNLAAQVVAHARPGS